jgi:hypothetical protein
VYQKAGPNSSNNFFSLWYRLRDDIIRRKVYSHPDITPHQGLCLFRLHTSTCNPWYPPPGPSTAFRTGIELLTMSSTDCNRATKLQWLWLFQPKCVSIYPRTSQNLKGIEILKIQKYDVFRNWTHVSRVTDSDTRRINHSGVKYERDIWKYKLGRTLSCQ